jgi:hypothetical protein
MDLPLLDHRLVGVPADRVGRVVGPDGVGIAVLVRVAVGVGDDDVAGLEVGHVRAHLEDLSDRGVAGIDLSAASLDDVDGVREHGVIDVVLSGDRQDPEMDVAAPDLAEIQLVELDHVREVDLAGIAARAFRLPGDGFRGDRVCAHLLLHLPASIHPVLLDGLSDTGRWCTRTGHSRSESRSSGRAPW